MIAAALCACGSSGPERGPYDTDPTEPEAAVKTFEPVDGFHVELFAAEPNVVDPVEICFDENGGVYVAEMLDYPFDPESGEQPRSRIRFLEDTDHDGRVDKATIFADHLLQVTSVFPWKGGVFAASAPRILYLKDDDGDHVADTQEVWYQGFDTDVSSESRITNFRLGLDNWIYAANNGRPGEITSPKFPEKPPLIVRGYDFRFNPVSGEFAAAAGPTQFGMSFNQWGDRFVTQNTVHLRHAVLPARYLLRNPLFTPPSMLEYVPDDDPNNSKVYPLTQPQEWRVERTEVRQERYDETQPGRVERVGGHFTAATGTTVYLGDAFGPDYYGNVFVADVNGGLVHREVLSDDGVSYRSQPRPQGKEFLASHDEWHRPANLANAPDGNLYLLDFYREYIEEPASIPETIKERLHLDFYRGNDRGRIWRIVPDRPAVKRGLDVSLGQASTAELVALLGHANGWHRTTAQRLLLERRDPSSAPPLRKLTSEAERAEVRLLALWALEGVGALEPADVKRAIGDQDAHVRRDGVRLAERFSGEPAAEIVGVIGDADPKVRFQVALSLGALPGPERAIATMAANESDDEWMRAALLSSVGVRPLEVFKRLNLSHADFFATATEGRREFVSGLGRLLGAEADPNRIFFFLQGAVSSPKVAKPEWLTAAMAGLSEGLSLSGKRGLRLPTGEALAARLMSNDDPRVQDAALELAQYLSLPGMVRDARAAAAADDISVERRVRAVRFLRGDRFASAEPVLREILSSSSAGELQAAAVETLGGFDEPKAAETILSGWQGYSPQARERVFAVLLRRKAGVSALLDAVESGAVASGHVDPLTRIRLTEYPDAALAARAAKLFDSGKSDRAQVVAQYRDALDLPADAERGKKAFDDNCAKCHVAQHGRSRLGPDLSGVNNKPREVLLTHILDPSLEIEASYANYIVIDRDGQVYDGLLSAETPAAVTLRNELEDVTILRDRIEEMRVSAVSLMPEGFENDLSRQQLADIIAYLRAGL